MHRSADHARHRERVRRWRRLPAERAMRHARGLIRLQLAPARFAHSARATEAYASAVRQTGRQKPHPARGGGVGTRHAAAHLSWHSSSRIRTILPFLPLVITPRHTGQSQPSRALSLPAARARLLRKAGTKLAHQSSPNSSSQARINLRARDSANDQRGRGPRVLRHAARTWPPAPCPARRRAWTPRP